MQRLRVIEDNLVVLVVLAAAVGLALPDVGIAMTDAVPWMLAGLVLCVSLTFDVQTLRFGADPSRTAGPSRNRSAQVHHRVRSGHMAASTACQALRAAISTGSHSGATGGA